jgi:hypothetical protein
MIYWSMGAPKCLYTELSFLLLPKLVFRRATTVKADLLAAPLCRDPLEDIWRTVCQNNASPLALREKSNAFLPNQGYVFEVQAHVSTTHFGSDYCLQLGDVFVGLSGRLT